MLTRADISWMKSELVPALSEGVKKDLSKRLDWIATMLDKQSGNLQSIETELTLISNLLESNISDQSALKSRVESLEVKVGINP